MNKRIITLAIIGTLLIMVLGTSLSYAVWISNSTQEDENIASSDCFNINLTSNSSALSVENDFPKTDEDGMKRDPYSFSIENTCETDAAYKIKIELQSTNDLPSNLTKVALNNKISLLSDLENENNNYFVIEENYLASGETKDYDFRQWFDEAGALENSQNKTISTKIVLESTASVLPPKGTEFLANLLSDGDTSLVNDDADQNIRYIGADPNNYVSFNGEKWRIIGAFNNIKTTEDGEGETRLKIIGPEYSDNIAWDEDDENDWSTASLQEELNGTYYNSLSAEAKSFIGETVWNLGGIDVDNLDLENNITLQIYDYERGTTVYEGRPTSWTGNVALMYPTDYIYATAGGTTTSRNACVEKMYYDDSLESLEYDCYNNNYLFHGTDFWMLSPHSSYADYVFYGNYYGHLYNFNANNGFGSSPVLNLKSEIKILSGNGSQENPYQIG